MRRADEPVAIKVIGFIALSLMPWKQRAIWDEHCARMQRKLDRERENGWGIRYIDKAFINF